MPKPAPAEEKPLLPPVEEVAQAIIDLSEAARRMMNTRLREKALVILLSHMSKIGQRDIEVILHNLQIMDKHWLKPLEMKGNQSNA